MFFSQNSYIDSVIFIKFSHHHTPKNINVVFDEELTSRHSMKSNLPSFNFPRFSKGSCTQVIFFRPLAFSLFSIEFFCSFLVCWAHFSSGFCHIQCRLAEVKINHLTMKQQVFRAYWWIIMVKVVHWQEWLSETSDDAYC